MGANVKFVSKPYGHTVPSTVSSLCRGKGYDLEKSCGYDGVGQMFRHFFKQIKPADFNYKKNGVFKRFD